MAVEPRPYKVFISHSSADTWVARQIARHVQERGAQVFLDVAHVEHGDDFDDKIRAEAESSDELLVLMTPSARKSPWIWIEIGLFRRDDKRIVAVLYGVTPRTMSPDDRLPGTLTRLNLLDINDIDRYFHELEARVVRRRRPHVDE